jgi:hypothetical protein
VQIDLDCPPRRALGAALVYDQRKWKREWERERDSLGLADFLAKSDLGAARGLSALLGLHERQEILLQSGRSSRLT